MSSPVPPKPLILIVAAMSPSLGIGHAGSLPWRLKSDLAYFSRVTRRLLSPPSSSPPRKNAVIMGRKTWFSIPPPYRPLPGRLNVVLSRDASVDLQTPRGEVLTATSLDDALAKLSAREEVERIFVIGGAEVYRVALDHSFTQSVLLTRIDTKFEVDTFFPVELAKEGVGWIKMGREALSNFVGEEVPEGVQREGGIEFEYELWQKQTK